jgi:hypothetical protein
MTSGQGWLSRSPLPYICKIQIYKAPLLGEEPWILKIPIYCDEVRYSFITFNTWSEAFNAAMSIQDFRNQP